MTGSYRIDLIQGYGFVWDAMLRPPLTGGAAGGVLKFDRS